MAGKKNAPRKAPAGWKPPFPGAAPPFRKKSDIAADGAKAKKTPAKPKGGGK